jgi:hypothetical protein
VLTLYTAADLLTGAEAQSLSSRGQAAPSAAGKIRITVMELTEFALVADGSC